MEEFENNEVISIQDRRSNNIRIFYEEISSPNQANHIEGSKYYKCWLGARVTKTVTAKMRGNLNGKLIVQVFVLASTHIISALVEHLESKFPAHHKMYLAIQKRETGATENELAIANGLKELNPETASKYAANLNKINANIMNMFNHHGEVIIQVS